MFSLFLLTGKFNVMKFLAHMHGP